MQEYDLRLAFIHGEPHFVVEHAPPGSEDFTFRLAHRNEQFGPHQFDHWWMDIRTIYRTRGRVAVNFDPLIEFWWRSCCENGTNVERSVCESYLLAKLFERTRSNGSRKVLIDSIPQRGNHSKRAEVVSNLENMLCGSLDEELSIVDFSRQTANFIGPPDFPSEVFDLQAEFNDQIFEDSVSLLLNGQSQAAIDSAVDVWENWQKRFGRRAHDKLHKQVMDILSYEARATIHRCYSHLWELVSYWLATEQRCSQASLVFHRAWHLDLTWPANDLPGKDFHLFHGHILGLHPGTNFFMQTNVGKQLIGDWLSNTDIGWQQSTNPESPELRRLLHGLALAIIDYSNRHEVETYLRQGSLQDVPRGHDVSDAMGGDGSIARISRSGRRGRDRTNLD